MAAPQVRILRRAKAPPPSDHRHARSLSFLPLRLWATDQCALALFQIVAKSDLTGVTRNAMGRTLHLKVCTQYEIPVCFVSPALVGPTTTMRPCSFADRKCRRARYPSDDRDAGS